GAALPSSALSRCLRWRRGLGALGTPGPRRTRTRGTTGGGISSTTGTTGTRGSRSVFPPGLGLIHPPPSVVVVRDRATIARRPAVHERVRVDTGDPVLRHLLQLEVREERKLGKQDRIEVRVLRRTATEGVQQRLCLVQVVHDRRMRSE